MLTESKVALRNEQGLKLMAEKLALKAAKEAMQSQPEYVRC